MNKQTTIRLTIALLLVFALVVTAQERYSGNVTRVPDNSSQPLDKFIADQASAAISRGADTVWVGYTMNVRPSMRSSSIQYAGGRNRWVSINRWGDHSDLPGIERVGSERKDLLFLFRKGSTTPEGLVLIDRTEDLRFTEPLVWLENVSAERSLKSAIAMAERMGEDDLRGGMMAVVAAHPGSEPPRFFLRSIRSNSSVEMRKKALYWYGHTLDKGDLGELPKLEGELKEQELRKHLTFVYHANESQAALDRLAHIARTDSDPEVAGQAIFWIGNMDDIDPVPIIRSIYKDIKNSEVREKAIFAASRTDRRSGLDFLMEIAKSEPNNDLREKAIFWIGRSDNVDALPLLKQIYESNTDVGIKEKVIFSISRIDDNSAAFDFLAQVARTESNENLREKAVFWIGRSDNEEKALSLIRSIYKTGGSVEFRKKLLFSASRIDNTAALDFLLEVARTDPSYELQKQAIFWIGHHDSESAALRHLKELYKSDIGTEARKQVLFSASRMDTDDAARFLLEVAKTEENRELRKQAVFWLSRTESAYADQYIKTVLDK